MDKAFIALFTLQRRAAPKAQSKLFLMPIFSEHLICIIGQFSHSSKLKSVKVQSRIKIIRGDAYEGDSHYEELELHHELSSLENQLTEAHAAQIHGPNLDQ